MPGPRRSIAIRSRSRLMHDPRWHYVTPEEARAEREAARWHADSARGFAHDLAVIVAAAARLVSRLSARLSRRDRRS